MKAAISAAFIVSTVAAMAEINYFEPEIAKAAVEVLEVAGCAVELPHGQLWRGRPLYDFGMLKLARRQLEQILDRRRPEIRDGVEIAVARTELHRRLPRPSC
jgi:Fe-S oxidoreductase